MTTIKFAIDLTPQEALLLEMADHLGGAPTDDLIKALVLRQAHETIRRFSGGVMDNLRPPVTAIEHERKLELRRDKIKNDLVKAEEELAQAKRLRLRPIK